MGTSRGRGRLEDIRSRLLSQPASQHRYEFGDHGQVVAGHRSGGGSGVAQAVRPWLQSNERRQSIPDSAPICPQAGGPAIAVCERVDPDPLAMGKGTECQDGVELCSTQGSDPHGNDPVQAAYSLLEPRFEVRELGWNLPGGDSRMATDDHLITEQFGKA